MTPTSRFLLSLAGILVGPPFGSGEVAAAQAPASESGSAEIRIVELQGRAEILPAGAQNWVLTGTNQVLRAHDRLRTGPNSRLCLRWSDQSLVPVGALSELEVLPPEPAGSESGLQLFRGILSFFHREAPGRLRVITRGAVAGVEGTEFVVSVSGAEAAESTTLSVIDGKVRLANSQAGVSLTNGQQAVAVVGQAPTLTAGFVANNILQWAFYYPAVLDVRDLPLTPEEQTRLASSLEAYRSGDVLKALDQFPAGPPRSPAETLYHAALLLSVGQVTPAETDLRAIATGADAGRLAPLAGALQQLIGAVKRQDMGARPEPHTATELLAASYYEQSRAVREESLLRALEMARKATAQSPEFGFAWERVAELEFSFGRSGKAREALDRSLALAPRNAQGLALKGFVLAAQNKSRAATAAFDEALAVDSALGNAWLGRGLCRIRRDDLAGGREDLLVAAGLEPQRGVLRSYLGKAYAAQGDYPRGRKELELAQQLDPADPTAFLYSALVKQQYNRVNEAVKDLEKSEDLNDNRRVYRSALLLDQDRAVRSANLASIYRDAGMQDVSLREASRAVGYDYANYSAHLFLANSYNELRDPNQVNLRYETPSESEYLIANLLAPASAGTMTRGTAQEDRFRLFQQNHLGVISTTEYLSRGAWNEVGAQYGIWENSAYSFEAHYRSDPGQRDNNDIEEMTLQLNVKQQITPRDMLYFQGSYYDAQGGDLFQYYDPASGSRTSRFKETQEPLLFLGYHHEWCPGMHTLVLGGRFDDTLDYTNPEQGALVTAVFGGEISAVRPILMNEVYRNRLELYSAELQQIWETPGHTTVAGGLYQGGEFHITDLQDHPSELAGLFSEPAADQNFEPDFQRTSIYAYHSWQILEPLLLVGGVSYDCVLFPENFRTVPLSDNEDIKAQWSPKVGLIWTPFRGTVLRGAYTRSLSGASLDQSFRLEPTQVAGFNQSFRSLIPESVAGANAGAEFETYGLSLEQKLPTGTYLGLRGELLKSPLERGVGAFELNLDVSDFAFPTTLREKLDFQERSLLFTVNQLLGEGFSAGAAYRFTRAQLDSSFPAVPETAFIFEPFKPQQNLDATLHQLDLRLAYNHACGFFAAFQALWDLQSNQGYSPELPDSDFWQFNAFAGYRLSQRRAEITVGVLNLADQDYRLNPLTLYNDLPRERTFVTRLALNF